MRRGVRGGTGRPPMFCRKGPVPRPRLSGVGGARGEREGPDDLLEGARFKRPILRRRLIVRRGARGEREGPDDLPEGARFKRPILRRRFIVRRGARGEREGPDDLPEGARFKRPILRRRFIVRRGARGEREGPDDLPEGARSPRSSGAAAPLVAAFSRALGVPGDVHPAGRLPDLLAVRAAFCIGVAAPALVGRFRPTAFSPGRSFCGALWTFHDGMPGVMNPMVRLAITHASSCASRKFILLLYNPPPLNRLFDSSKARRVSFMSYGCSAKVLGSHSLRGVAKKSPP